MMINARSLIAISALSFCVTSIAPGGSVGEPIVLFDQIGPSPASLSGSASSSQFPPDNPQGVFATVDNFSIHSDSAARGGSTHITAVEAVVGGLQNFGSFDDVITWNVQIYSSLSAASSDYFGDVYGKSFDTPSAMTSGYATYSGRPAEIATFEVDFILQPGEYWMTVAMENDGALNGTAGILHSFIGDGPCYFAVPSQNASFPLSWPAAYRVIGEAVPAPGTLTLLGGLGYFFTRRRRSFE